MLSITRLVPANTQHRSLVRVHCLALCLPICSDLVDADLWDRNLATSHITQKYKSRTDIIVPASYSHIICGRRKWNRRDRVTWRVCNFDILFCGYHRGRRWCRRATKERHWFGLSANRPGWVGVEGGGCEGCSPQSVAVQVFSIYFGQTRI